MQNMNPWRVFAYWHAAAGLLSKVQDETLTTLAWLVKEEECVLSHCIRSLVLRRNINPPISKQPNCKLPGLREEVRLLTHYFVFYCFVLRVFCTVHHQGDGPS